MPKQKIIEAAFESFAKGHYNCVSLSEIADKAGIKKPSIYFHFQSKEKLFLEVLDIELSKLYTYIDKVFNDNTFQDTNTSLHKFLLASIDYIVVNKLSGDFWGKLIFVTPINLHNEIGLRIDEFKTYIQNLIFKLIQQGVDKGELITEDTNNLVYSYICLLEGNLLMALSSKLFDLEKVNMSWNFFWCGIRKRD